MKIYGWNLCQIDMYVPSSVENNCFVDIDQNILASRIQFIIKLWHKNQSQTSVTFWKLPQTHHPAQFILRKRLYYISHVFFPAMVLAQH